MSLKVSAPDGVKVYNITGGGKTLPQWLSEGKKKSLKKDADYRRRVELIQDFNFPAACQRIKISPNQEYMFAVGYHPPMMKTYDLSNLSMKFERHMDAEVIDFQCLTEDFSKLAFLCSDRTVAFHARFGAYYKLRVPRCGRDLAYLPSSAEMLVAGSAPELYRISLLEGRFMTPLPTRSPAVNVCGVSPVHGLVGCAGEDGIMECFDIRQKQAAGWIDAANACGAAGEELTALRFDDTGMQVACGTRNGLVALFDLRSQKPLLVKDHMYGTKIVDIKFHQSLGDGMGPRRIISSDTHIVKIWDANDGKNYTSIEPQEGDINDVCVWPGSGLIMVGCDNPRGQAFFVPSLGPAPRWCSHLEGLTEELEEQAPALYDDYRFVTKSDLVKLGLEHLMGTPILRAYMHGFFIDNRLYQKAKTTVDPFAYETYRQQRIDKKLEDERKSRISMVKKLPKVNAKMAARLLTQEATTAAAAAGDEAAAIQLRRAARNSELPSAELLRDDRFKELFEDKDFRIDESCEEYKMLHPNVGRNGKSSDDALLKEHFEELGSGAEDDEEEEGDSEDSLDEMDAKPRVERTRSSAKVEAKGGKGKQQDQDRRKGGKAGPAMYAARSNKAADAFRKRETMSALMSLPLAERAAHAGQQRTGKRVGGSREVSFTPRSAGVKKRTGRPGGFKKGR